MTELTQARLKEVLHYDPDTGYFTWAIRKSQRCAAGDRAGLVDKGAGGYIRIKVDGRSYLAHRLAFLYMEGVWPPKVVDHRNTNRVDNSWLNIRHANWHENACNKRLRSDNTIRLKGVHLHTSTGKWRAPIQVQGVRKSLGLYRTPEAAHAAYCAAAKTLHGEFLNGGEASGSV